MMRAILIAICAYSATLASTARAKRETPLPYAHPRAIAADSDTTLSDPFFDNVVAAARLRPLSQTRLPVGSREIRVWIGGGIGWPQDLYRITVRGPKVSGQWIRYWRRDVNG